MTAASPAFRRAVGRALAEINGTGLAREVQDPSAGHLISANSRDALIRFQLRGADSTVSTVLAAVARAQAASPGFTMTETGDASAQQALNNNISSNFGRAEWTAVPLAIGVLLVVFGALMAAVLPVLLAGLAVGVDYSLFYLFRERQERAAGRARADALQVAAATSGRSVLVSGMIVMTGMVGMLLSGMATFQSLGVWGSAAEYDSAPGISPAIPSVYMSNAASDHRRSRDAPHPGPQHEHLPRRLRRRRTCDVRRPDRRRRAAVQVVRRPGNPWRR